ncbi:cytochrome P450 [Stackebrandtia endophytica]|uniref:Cytochrome P450 n=1 Tax=Stackebrandtia endophytica TaxID=1496996 RepID=A0A543B3J5_9ACTN|nr:cytochrome P450 [Stackebrandtia endophytica]TQL79415.1 cytochrome P450 [Stackebrandtia endophytica]
MTDPATSNPPPFPMPRTCPFGPPPQYEQIRREAPISRVTLQDGKQAWLITGHAVAREFLSSNRISSSRANPDFPQVAPGVATVPLKGAIIAMDPPEHSHHRRMITNEFTVKRVKRMRPQIQQITDRAIDDLLARPKPADLVEALSLPVPSLVICELLGVPYTDREQFQSRSQIMLSRRSTADQRRDAALWLLQYLNGLVAGKEAERGDDLLSRLIDKYRDIDAYDRQTVAGMGLLLLIGGHETTANMISLSVVSLMEDPQLLDGLRRQPERTPQLVEELLRFHSVVDVATSRVVVEDFELGGVGFRAGDGVIVAAAAASHDPAVFTGPDTIDVERGARHHLAFGFGVHQCIGQNLARLELEIVLNTLFARVPDLALAEPVERLPYKQDALVYGIHRLPVTW